MPDPNGVDIANMYVGRHLFGRHTPPSRDYAKDGLCCSFEEPKPHVIAPQGEGESNADFRARVAGALRAADMIVDAHEVFSNRFHDEKTEDGEPGNAAAGIVGHVALALAGEHGRPRNVGQSGSYRDFDDEIITGQLERAGAFRMPSKGEADAMLMLIAAMSGGR